MSDDTTKWNYCWVRVSEEAFLSALPVCMALLDIDKIEHSSDERLWRVWGYAFTERAGLHEVIMEKRPSKFSARLEAVE